MNNQSFIGIGIKKEYILPEVEGLRIVYRSDKTLIGKQMPRENNELTAVINKIKEQLKTLKITDEQIIGIFCFLDQVPEEIKETSDIVGTKYDIFGGVKYDLRTLALEKFQRDIERAQRNIDRRLQLFEIVLQTM
jgi:hypothetical protein